jgi:4-alpha-glucanotransferase
MFQRSSYYRYPEPNRFMKPAVPLLEKLLYLRGISADYFSYAGEHITHPLESRLKFLQATGYDINDQIQIEQAIHTLDAEPWTHCLAEFNIATQGDCYVEVRLHPDELNQTINWQVLTELDEHYQGSAIAADLADIGHYVIKGVRYSARRLDLPALASGYHQLQLSTEQRQATASLAISPARSYQPTNIDHKLWGVSCQLYTLRSLRNWGIGDFSD